MKEKDVFCIHEPTEHLLCSHLLSFPVPSIQMFLKELIFMFSACLSQGIHVSGSCCLVIFVCVCVCVFFWLFLFLYFVFVLAFMCISVLVFLRLEFSIMIMLIKRKPKKRLLTCNTHTFLWRVYSVANKSHLLSSLCIHVLCYIPPCWSGVNKTLKIVAFTTLVFCLVWTCLQYPRCAVQIWSSKDMWGFIYLFLLVLS